MNALTSLPHPGAPKIDNCIATLWMHGNRRTSLSDKGLDSIANAQGFDPVEFRARFCELETILAKQQWAKTTQPQNTYETEGK